MTEKIFDNCVKSLEWSAKKLHMTYEELNVLIFVIGWPIVTIGLIIAYLNK